MWSSAQSATNVGGAYQNGASSLQRPIASNEAEAMRPAASSASSAVSTKPTLSPRNKGNRNAPPSSMGPKTPRPSRPLFAPKSSSMDSSSRSRANSASPLFTSSVPTESPAGPEMQSWGNRDRSKAASATRPFDRRLVATSSPMLASVSTKSISRATGKTPPRLGSSAHRLSAQRRIAPSLGISTPMCSAIPQTISKSSMSACSSKRRSKFRTMATRFSTEAALKMPLSTSLRSRHGRSNSKVCWTNISTLFDSNSTPMATICAANNAKRL
mmetsp:Transcript_113499/g.360761  ORF Transcript_113499/g.360761 Transcript_113499/m.360761 type:complete len:271 (+) Transcript_113499:1185-1997(+)